MLYNEDQELYEELINIWSCLFTMFEMLQGFLVYNFILGQRSYRLKLPQFCLQIFTMKLEILEAVISKRKHAGGYT